MNITTWIAHRQHHLDASHWQNGSWGGADTPVRLPGASRRMNYGRFFFNECLWRWRQGGLERPPHARPTGRLLNLELASKLNVLKIVDHSLYT